MRPFAPMRAAIEQATSRTRIPSPSSLVLQSPRPLRVCRACAAHLGINRFQSNRANFSSSTKQNRPSTTASAVSADPPPPSGRVGSREVEVIEDGAEGGEEASAPPKTWHGLEWVGSPDFMNKYMVPTRTVEPFFRNGVKSRIREPELVEDAILRAFAQLQLLRANGLPLHTLEQAPRFEEVIGVTGNSDGTFELRFAGPGSESNAQRSADSTVAADAETSVVVTPFEGSGAWSRISIADPDIKFYLLKRLRQTLQYAIPDAEISTLERLGQLHKLLSAKPKAATVIQAVKDDLLFEGLGNVELHEGRFRTEEKEKRIGRWKVVEAELRRRRLK